MKAVAERLALPAVLVHFFRFAPTAIDCASEDIGLVDEDTAANVRPIIRETSPAAAILLGRGWGKAKEMHEHSEQS